MAVSKNLAANAATTALVAGYQLVSVPVFLSHWGLAKYGEWIALTAAAGYFQLTDIGLNTATANSLCFAYAEQDFNRCAKLLTNNIIFVCASFTVAAIFAIAVAKVGGFVALLNPKELSPTTVNYAVLLLIAQIFVGTLTNLLTGVYRATNQFVRSVNIDNCIRAAEYATMLATVVNGWNIVEILVCGVCVKLLGLIAKALGARRFTTLTVGFQYFSPDELRNMIRPAFAFLLLPIANSFALQGAVLAANYFVGGAAVVAFTTARAMTNFGRSLIDILQRSIWPEATNAWGKGDHKRVAMLYRRGVIVSVGVTLAIAAGLACFGERLYVAWTRGRSDWMPTMFALLLVDLVAAAFVTSNSTILQAINRHGRLSMLTSMAAILAFLLSLAITAGSRDVKFLPMANLVANGLIIWPIGMETLRVIDPKRSAYGSFGNVIRYMFHW